MPEALQLTEKQKRDLEDIANVFPPAVLSVLMRGDMPYMRLLKTVAKQIRWTPESLEEKAFGLAGFEVFFRARMQDLELKGYVVRTTHEDCTRDRVNCYSATPRGREAFPELKAQWEEYAQLRKQEIASQNAVSVPANPQPLLNPGTLATLQH